MINSNIVWHKNKVSPNDRRHLLGQKPVVLWFTGLSGSGKSTIASEVERQLVTSNHSAYLLDGDNLRHGINSNLGFSEGDRDENIRRISEVARLFADSGLITLVSAISPFKATRDYARSRIGEICDFVEVYIKADVKTCSLRDPKGLYKKAISGEIKEFTGISSPYEIPENPEIVLDTAKLTVNQCVNTVLEYIQIQQINTKELLASMISSSIEAGKAIMDIYNRDFEVEYKDDKSPLTQADKASNDIICNNLKKDFPYYSILTEETADDKTYQDLPKRLYDRYCFVVDPLDGTKEFIKKNGEFTVNIALTYNHKTIIGVIYVPATKTLYYASHKKGAYKVTDIDITNINKYNIFDVKDKINVSNRVENLVVMESRSHGDTRLDDLLDKNQAKIAKTISHGSSLKGCLIAEGLADIYYRFGFTMEWDTAAMQCVCEEACAVFKQCDDSDMAYNRQNSLNEKGFYILNRIENKLH